MTISKKKIEIHNVDLDIDLDSEIKKHATLDTDTKDKITNIINIARERAKKPVDPEELAWNEKFEKLYTAFNAAVNCSISKSGMIELLGIQAADLGKVIAMFKKFLRVHKNNEYTLMVDPNPKSRYYNLKRIV